MKCPHCGFQDSRVLDSRDTHEGVRRRRQCMKCNSRFTTQERPQQIPLYIIKKDKRREPFQKEKVLNGMRKACEKRPIPSHVIERLSDEIETELIALGRDEVPSSVIGDMVMERLKSIDHIAYIRFASIYRDFTDITRLKQEVDSLAGVAVNAPVAGKEQSTQLPLLPDAGRLLKMGRHKR